MNTNETQAEKSKDNIDHDAPGADDYHHGGGDADEDMRQEQDEYDDDDEVDFNLGGPAASNGYAHQDDGSMSMGMGGGSYSKPSAKEDG